MAKPFCEFPKDFLWGAATAAYQIEGGATDDGRGPSVWDTFCRRPGAIAMDHTGDVACDHYHRYKEDVALMKRLGLKAYRFSVSWPRVFPNDSKQHNPKGLDFYRRLTDELLGAGIEPWMTLFHWDLPQWCEDRFGGWESADCSRAFADYAGFMAKHVGDRVSGIFTINEFVCFTDMGYGAAGELFAPGRRVNRKTLNQIRHHAVYGHGLAAQAIRAANKRPLVGLAENMPATVPLLETEEDIAAARTALRELTGMFLTPIFEGAYHPAYLESAAADAPHFTDEQMRVIHSPLDFLGLNLYAPIFIRHDGDSPRGWAKIETEAAYPRMHMPWLAIHPSIVYWAPRLASELWKTGPILITENGCAYPDRPTGQNEVLDNGRVMFLQQHFIHAHRAVSEGIPLKGYFVWSLMDNFEWAYGYTKRFGICYTNYQTQERIPKLSARFYAGVIARNAVGGDATESRNTK